jgi:hypothetical protein
MELGSSLRETSARWKEIKKTDMAALNQLLEQEKVAKIDPERQQGDGPSADTDGDDEP